MSRHENHISIINKDTDKRFISYCISLLHQIISLLLTFVLLSTFSTCNPSSLITTTAWAEEVVIANPDINTKHLKNMNKNTLRAIFGMRLRTWPDNSPIRVFVLKDDDPTHISFAKKQLSIFPQQLRRAWDRLIYSGTGQAPREVASEEEMRDLVASTTGAIGYIDKDKVSDEVRVVEVE